MSPPHSEGLPFPARLGWGLVWPHPFINRVPDAGRPCCPCPLKTSRLAHFSCLPVSTAAQPRPLSLGPLWEPPNWSPCFRSYLLAHHLSSSLNPDVLGLSHSNSHALPNASPTHVTQALIASASPSVLLPVCPLLLVSLVCLQQPNLFLP